MTDNYVIETHSCDPYYNLAFEEYLLNHYSAGNIVMFWQNDSSVVVGKNQNVFEEIDMEYVKARQIRVVRRMTGGGAVYHDRGNLNYSFISDYHEAAEKNDLKEFAAPVTEILQSLGIPAEFSGRNDIVVGNRKISGTAQRIENGRILHHGCLLIAADLSELGRCLKPRPEKYRSKAVKSVRSRVANVQDFLEQKITVDEFRKTCMDYFMQEQQYHRLELPEQELKKIRKLRDEKYATWEWNYGQPIRCQIHNAHRFEEAGSVEVFLEMKRGRILKIHFQGDYMARLDTSVIEDALTDCCYRYEDIVTVLKGFQLRNYFGRISPEELAILICS